MKVILTSNIKKLGKVGDLVNVKVGFARNFLFPQKKALRKNKKNLEHFDKLKEEIALKEKSVKENAENILNKLDNVKIEFEKEADEKNQLYGSVTTKEIQSYLLEKKINFDIDDIQIINPIKSLGEHTISINPYADLSKEIKIFVNKAKEK